MNASEHPDVPKEPEPHSNGEERVVEGTVLYRPSEERVRTSRMSEYMDWLAEEGGLAFESYADLWRWSVTEVGDFWCTIWDYFEIHAYERPRGALADARMPGAVWFPGATLNYAEHALRRRGPEIAVIALDESGGRAELSWDELRDRVSAAQRGLRRLGVGRGDRVAAFLPNGVEALVCFLATASLGAIWSSCSPEFGVPSVLDRLRQIEPKVLLAVDGYRYGGKAFDRSAAVEEIASGLPTLAATVVLSVLGTAQASRGFVSFDELMRRGPDQGEPTFEPVPFEHPLWILYSSGTTGLPKPIVQGHGGILLEHVKALGLHCELGEGDRFFWFSTTGWMMWNFLVGGLLVGATIVLYDGSPAHPDLSALWALAEREKITYFGASAPYLVACDKAEIEPNRYDLSSLVSLGSTGAPLPVSGFAWVYEHVKKDVLLCSISGGTDVCTAFALSCAVLPVRAGALQCAGLGCKIEAWDESGKSVVGEVGELMLTAPLPSMPLFFWGDADGERYRQSYFDVYPGVWRHGDWVKLSEDGSLVISGRSDSTLNRGGVRMGTSELYACVERVPGVMDSLVVDAASAEEPSGKLWLFVVLEPGQELDAAMKQRLVRAIREEISPRHVPDEVLAVRAIPRTLSGKKCEIPVKRILSGVDPRRAVNPDTLTDPTSIDELVALVRRGAR